MSYIISYLQRTRLNVLLACVGTIISCSIAHASTTVPLLPDDAPKVVIYNVTGSGEPILHCEIPIEKLDVNFSDNKYGCDNDQAYFFSLNNVPSMTKIWLLSEKDCNIENTDADWIFNVLTNKKQTTTTSLGLNGLKGILEFKQKNPDRHAILAPGVELIGGQYVRRNIEGKLSCVRIVPPTADTSLEPKAPSQTDANIKVTAAVSSAATLHASSYINLWGSPEGDGLLDCTIPASYSDGDTHRFDQWVTAEGITTPANNRWECPENDVYALELVNVPSGTLINLSSEAACYMNGEDSRTPDWIVKLKTTKKVTTVKRLEISDIFAADVQVNKPLPIDLDAPGVFLVYRIHNKGNIKGKLSCIQVIPPTQDNSTPGQ